MPRKRKVGIPANVLAQRGLREMYAKPPEPEKLVLAELTMPEGQGMEIQGVVSGLTYSLSRKFFYIDPRDIDGLSDMAKLAKKRGRPRKKLEKKAE